MKETITGNKHSISVEQAKNYVMIALNDGDDEESTAVIEQRRESAIVAHLAVYLQNVLDKLAINHPRMIDPKHYPSSFTSEVDPHWDVLYLLADKQPDGEQFSQDEIDFMQQHIEDAVREYVRHHNRKVKNIDRPQNYDDRDSLNGDVVIPSTSPLRYFLKKLFRL